LKLNIFRIPDEYYEWLIGKLQKLGADPLANVKQDGWTGTFFISPEDAATDVPWLEPYEQFFVSRDRPQNTNHYAAFVFKRDSACYALSHGKAHFYIRPFSDFDFGVELAKRIANEDEIRQTASKRFAGKQKKDIRSFAPNTRLDVESGESVDFLQAECIPEVRADFGKTGKFGTSALLSPDITAHDIGSTLSKVESEIRKPAKFRLPRTTLLTDDETVRKYDRQLVEEILSGRPGADFAQASYDLYGVDFIFSEDGQYKYRCPGFEDGDIEMPDIESLRGYIAENGIPKESVLRIRVVHNPPDRATYSKDLKNSLDFIYDEDRVILTAGRWMHFNQDYLDFLDEYLDGISVESVEPEFATLSPGEPAFNENLRKFGYNVADKNFDILKTRSSTPIEAWDLQKGDCVYAVKFGTAQKLGYVCDQATAVLEVLRNRANVKKVPNFRQYCLWLGYEAKKPLGHIKQTGSIILKQKIEAWARKATNLRIEPVIKLSHKTN
jgi:uncharacterized protein (TIGR04141 family)